MNMEEAVWGGIALLLLVIMGCIMQPMTFALSLGGLLIALACVVGESM